MRSRLALLPLLAVAFLGVMSPVALAQQTCQPFSAVIQAAIVLDPDSLPIDPQPGFEWGGTVYGLLGNNKDYLGGWFYGKDAATEATYGKANGRGTNGVYMFAFGRKVEGGFDVTDTFDLQLGQAVWTVDAHSTGYAGNYKASGTMANGTGVFAGATGNFRLHGGFAFWLVENTPVSAWNPALVGRFCK